MSRDDDEKKIVIYHEQWCSMDANQIDVIQPMDMTRRVVPREDMLFPEGQETLPENTEVVMVKSHQLWTTNPEGELDVLLYDSALARKLTSAEKTRIEAGFLVNGATVAEMNALFHSGEFKDAT